MTEGPERSDCDLLVVAAHAVELEGLCAELRERKPDPRFAGVRLATVGVGMTAAGAGAARAIAECVPRAVILVGSFGRYPGRAPRAGEPTTAFVFEHVQAVDPGQCQGLAAFPAPMPLVRELDRALSASLCRAGAERLGTLGTTLAITTDDALAAELSARSGCDGESLEALVVAEACATAGLPCAVLAACTNEVGAQGRTQWLARHVEAARTTARVLEAYLCTREPRR